MWVCLIWSLHIKHLSTCWQLRWLSSQQNCQPGLFGFCICDSICTWKHERKFSFEPKLWATWRCIGSPWTPVSQVKFSPGHFRGRVASASMANLQTPVTYMVETSVRNRPGGCDHDWGNFSAIYILSSKLLAIQNQALPMISKQQEHLRMNLWQSNAF